MSVHMPIPRAKLHGAVNIDSFAFLRINGSIRKLIVMLQLNTNCLHLFRIILSSQFASCIAISQYRNFEPQIFFSIDRNHALWWYFQFFCLLFYCSRFQFLWSGCYQNRSRGTIYQRSNVIRWLLQNAHCLNPSKGHCLNRLWNKTFGRTATLPLQ